jgi:hypothetical protein
MHFFVFYIWNCACALPSFLRTMVSEVNIAWLSSANVILMVDLLANICTCSTSANTNSSNWCTSLMKYLMGIFNYPSSIVLSTISKRPRSDEPIICLVVSTSSRLG